MQRAHDSTVPLGVGEGATLAFLPRASLSRPEEIARQVVGMLNAAGGTLWVGVHTEGGIAVGMDPFAVPPQLCAEVLDQLRDTVEPMPDPGEIRCGAVAVGGGALLRIAIAPLAGRGPRAQLVAGAWRGFYCRRDRGLVVMSREELAAAFHGTSWPPNPGEDHAPSTKLHASALWSDRPSMRLCVGPNTRICYPTETQRDFITTLLADPLRSGNRHGGFHFTSLYNQLRPEPGGLRFGDTDGYTTCAFFDDGDLTFEIPLANFVRGPASATGHLYPLALLEYPVSLLRLARAYYAHDEIAACLGAQGDDGLQAAARIDGLDGWTLCAGSPSDPFHGIGSDACRTYASGAPLVVAPTRFSHADLHAAPDRCAWPLLRRIYAAFGLWESSIPPEFDRTAGVLRLPGL